MCTRLCMNIWGLFGCYMVKKKITCPYMCSPLLCYEVGARKSWRLQDQSLAVKVDGKLRGIRFVWKVKISSYMACLCRSVRHPVIQHRVYGSQSTHSTNWPQNLDPTLRLIRWLGSDHSRHVHSFTTCCNQSWLRVVTIFIRSQHDRLIAFVSPLYFSISSFFFFSSLPFFSLFFFSFHFFGHSLHFDDWNVGFSVSKPLNNIVTNVINRWHHSNRPPCKGIYTHKIW